MSDEAAREPDELVPLAPSLFGLPAAALGGAELARIAGLVEKTLRRPRREALEDPTWSAP